MIDDIDGTWQVLDSTYDSKTIQLKPENVLGCPWKLVTIVSKLGYNLLTGRVQPTFIGVN